MTDTSSFVYIVDRYLEVSNVYHRRMSVDALIEDDKSQKERLQHLALLAKEGADKSADRPVEINEIRDGGEGGQIVTTTKEFLNSTKHRQKDILRRLENMPSWAPMPSNFNRLKHLLELEAGDFLGSFPSPSYASDVLSELASLTVCPDVNFLAARDLVHMHAVELQLHLARVIAQAKLYSPEKVKVNVSLTVDQLRKLENAGQLTEELVESSVPRDPVRLFEELSSFIKHPADASKWLEKNKDFTLDRLIKQNQFFLDALEEIRSPKDAIKICNSLVLYGLVATYAAWFSCALERPEEKGYFRTNILFCTRILLDEKRWQICKDFAKIALGAMKELNDLDGNKTSEKGTGMLTANLFFSRLKCGESLENLKEEIKGWDVEKLHRRYHFLKAVLLEDFELAGTLSLELLNTREKTGVPNMCIQEFREWPILEKFRRSEQGKKLLDSIE